MKRIFIIVLVFQLIGCDYTSKKLKIVNNTNETKFCIYKLDTTLRKYAPQTFLELLPHSYIMPSMPGKGDLIWEHTINNHSIDSTLYIYFFDTNQIDESIVSQHRYKRFDYKVKELDNINWVVEYK
jgi:hypothetical protein